MEPNVTDLRYRVYDLETKVKELENVIEELLFSIKFGQLKTEIVNEAMREVIARDMRKGY